MSTLSVGEGRAWFRVGPTRDEDPATVFRWRTGDNTATAWQPVTEMGDDLGFYVWVSVVDPVPHDGDVPLAPGTYYLEVRHLWGRIEPIVLDIT